MDGHASTSLHAAWAIGLGAPLGLVAMFALLLHAMRTTASVRCPARARREQAEDLAASLQGQVRVPGARRPATALPTFEGSHERVSGSPAL